MGHGGLPVLDREALITLRGTTALGSLCGQLWTMRTTNPIARPASTAHMQHDIVVTHVGAHSCCCMPFCAKRDWRPDCCHTHRQFQERAYQYTCHALLGYHTRNHQLTMPFKIPAQEPCHDTTQPWPLAAWIADCRATTDGPHITSLASITVASQPSSSCSPLSGQSSLWACFSYPFPFPKRCPHAKKMSTWTDRQPRQGQASSPRAKLPSHDASI